MHKSNLSFIFQVALKRQQAAEDAIALSMAKVTTGQKLSRLPPGKIFGMTVTEPDTVTKSKLSLTSTNEKELSNESKAGTDDQNVQYTIANAAKIPNKIIKVIIHSEVFKINLTF